MLSQDIKSYEDLQNLLKLIFQSENDVENNKLTNQDEMFDNLEKRLFD